MRYKLTPLQELPAAHAASYAEVVHEGDEASRDQRLNDLHALTGVPFEAAEYSDDDARKDDERENKALKRQSRKASED
ncbi:hypothetical protein [uncultured Variovorax sp.]|uniref:hypothetical protein n=1 Tax=uncultured Variovorax sp. TaxID=114708 RepID=UPI00261C5085|nr:hypothetical protein [uncultured Variovorax sp.]